MGAYAKKTGSDEKETLKHGVQPSDVYEKIKATSTIYVLEAYSPDVAICAEVGSIATAIMPAL